MQNKHSQNETIRTAKCKQIKLNEKVNEQQQHHQQQKMEQIFRQTIQKYYNTHTRQTATYAESWS